MATKREEFLAGDRLDDVALFFSEESLSDPGVVAEYAEAVEGGYVLVVDGDRGRSVFSAAVGVDAMSFARSAMERDGSIDQGLSGGECPDADGADHDLRYLLAFVQAETPDAGGLYAEGDVIHAYARCACDTAYSDRWLAGEP